VINGCIPLHSDPKKPLRRTLLPGYLVLGGLPPDQAPEPDAGAGIQAERCSSTPSPPASSNTKQGQQSSILDCADEDFIA
jgi:hypothetical protein